MHYNLRLDRQPQSSRVIMPHDGVKSIGGANDRLVKSGHYFYDDRGRIVSSHFAQKPSNAYFFKRLISGTVKDIEIASFSTGVYGLDGLLSGQSLCNYVRIELPGKPPVYVVDDHHIAFFAWHEAFVMGYIEKGSSLIHIDAHSDFIPSRLCGRAIDGRNLAAIAEVTRSSLCIGTFIRPAINATHLLEEAFFYCKHPWENLLHLEQGEQAYLSPSMPHANLSINELLDEIPTNRIVLDIDIDAYVDTADIRCLSSFFSEIDKLVQLAKRSGVVTLATSPGFADQKLAAEFAREFVRRLAVS